MVEVAMTALGSEGGGELVGQGKGRSNWPTVVLKADELILAVQIRGTPNSRKHRFVTVCVAWPSESGPCCHRCLLCVNIGDGRILVYSAPTHG